MPHISFVVVFTVDLAFEVPKTSVWPIFSCDMLFVLDFIARPGRLI